MAVLAMVRDGAPRGRTRSGTPRPPRLTGTEMSRVMTQQVERVEQLVGHTALRRRSRELGLREEPGRERAWRGPRTGYRPPSTRRWSMTRPGDGGEDTGGDAVHALRADDVPCVDLEARVGPAPLIDLVTRIGPPPCVNLRSFVNLKPRFGARRGRRPLAPLAPPRAPGCSAGLSHGTSPFLPMKWMIMMKMRDMPMSMRAERPQHVLLHRAVGVDGHARGEGGGDGRGGGESSEAGMTSAPPMTMRTASVSPKARVMPRMTAVMSEGSALLSTTCRMVCRGCSRARATPGGIRPAPRAARPWKGSSPWAG